MPKHTSDISLSEDKRTATVTFTFESFQAALAFKMLADSYFTLTQQAIIAQKEMTEVSKVQSL